MLTGLFLFLIITIGGTIAFFRGAYGWYDQRYRWREREYAKLYALKAGFTPATYEKALGPPVFRRTSADHHWLEATFRGRSYWVQIVWRRGSTATAYFAVTSCSRSFNPTFHLPDTTALTLNRTNLGTVRFASPTDAFADYSFPSATANAHFYDVSYGGNPGNYKTFAWGFDDACLNMPNWTGYVPPRLEDSVYSTGRFQARVSSVSRLMQRFRRDLPINTYAETAPASNFAEAATEFQVGVDRILVRTVTFPTYSPPPGSESTKALPVEPDYTGLNREPAKIRDAAHCLQSPLVLHFPDVLAGTGTFERYFHPPVPASIRSYVGKRFLVVDAEFGGRRFQQQRAIIFFPVPVARVSTLAHEIRSNERGFIQVLRSVVVLWRVRPNAQEKTLVRDCTFG